MNICLYFKKFPYCQQLSNTSDEQIPNPYESCVTYPAVHRNVKIGNDYDVKTDSKSDEGNVASKTFMKAFDTSSITGKLNLKGVSVSRNSLSRRISSHNSHSETSNVDKLGVVVESDTSTNSSIASGFTLNMFQTRGPFTMKSLLKQDQKAFVEPKSLFSKSVEQQRNVGENNEQIVDYSTINDFSNSINKPQSRSINLSNKSAQNHPHLNVYPGLCGIPRLHDFADPLPSPASAVASLTRDLESDLHQLELRDWAVQGQYVVKPQVNLKNNGDFRGSVFRDILIILIILSIFIG